MKKLLSALLILIFISSTSYAHDKETSYDRIMKTKTIKCGYVVHDPYVIIEPNTGNMSGITYDIMNEIAKRLSLKIEWTEEVGWGNFIEGLKTKRYDMLCSGGWNSANEGILIGYSKPLYYSGIGIWVRGDDNRFDNDLSLINNPDIKISSSDGSLVTIIAQNDFPNASILFPNASILSMPNLTPTPEIIHNIVTKKADVTFMESYTANKYIKSNPGKIKNIAKNNPVRLFPTSLIFPHEDYRLKFTLDAAIDELMYSGFIDKILDKYEISENSFYRIAKPYEVPK